MKKGILVALEGIDGSGKSTQAVLLKLHLERQHISTRIIKAKSKKMDKPFNDFVEAVGLLPDSLGYMFAYQVLHRKQYERTVEAVDRGEVVIADRWNTSFFIYHNQFGSLANQTQKTRDMIDSITFDNLCPDLCVFLDVPVNISFTRRIIRGDKSDFSEEEKSFYENVRQEYLRIVKHNGWVVIDGCSPVEIVHQEIFRNLEHCFKQKRSE